MAIHRKKLKGTTTEHSSFTGAEGVITYDSDLKTLRVHDNETPGGILLLTSGNVMTLTGNQTIGGIKTFSSRPVIPNASANNNPVALGQTVVLTGNQTIGGIKTFSSSPVIPNASANNNPVALRQLLSSLQQIEFPVSAGNSGLTFSGIFTSVSVDSNSVGVGALLTMSSDGHYDLASANSVNTMCFALALETGTGNKKVLLEGHIRNDSWNWSLGNGARNLLYMHTSLGIMTQTKPSGEDNVIQVVGRVVSSNIINFKPSLDYITYKI